MWKNRTDQDSQVCSGHWLKYSHRNSLGRSAQIIIGGEIIHGWAETAIASYNVFTNPPPH
jgi:hypothetical protein